MPRLTDWLTGDGLASEPGGASPQREKTLADKLVQMRKALKGVIGAPNYEAYLAHHKAIHPDVPPMSEGEFFRFAIDRRYSKPGGGMRCC